MSLDLSLPATCPALCRYSEYSWDLAAFALYTLIDLPPGNLSDLVTLLNKEHFDYGSETPLVRTPDTYNFAGQTLKDVVQAHVDLDKEITPCSGGIAKGTLGWYPSAFLVVTTRNWATEGLLCVFLDDTTAEENEDGLLDPEVRPMDKFFMPLDEAPLLLSSFSLMDLGFVDAKEQYGLEQRANRKDEGDEHTEVGPAEREEGVGNDEDVDERKEDVNNGEEGADNREGEDDNAGHYRLSTGEVVFFPDGASVGDEVIVPTFTHPGLDVRVAHIVEEVSESDA
ncbi:uncharacterized protein LDX57_000860 [Aspergillus melleus]|uniref:uncharacterized protein n=1 Tax=Aspergillus melleus TaxID=138277 RepID=UPI001E8E3A36|nr:uncharacterized protein LDX57_000860 [Aspergillus melleus]KAH8423104.1 hypothetical protein LDX57_000860 [Aspergillus melleus]